MTTADLLGGELGELRERGPASAVGDGEADRPEPSLAEERDGVEREVTADAGSIAYGRTPGASSVDTSATSQSSKNTPPRPSSCGDVAAHT